MTPAARENVVVLLPSLGRGASDFDDLSARLAAGGCRAVPVDPRGIGDERPLDGVTLHDLAADVADRVEGLDTGPVAVVGHAFGNRVARCLAADRPDLVRAVVLLAAGGRVHPSEEVLAAMGVVLDEGASAEAHLAALSTAFFAPGNDPTPWRDGWHRKAARAQSAATRRTPVDDWWGAGSAPVLVVQGLEDRCAPRENGRLLHDEFPDRVELVELAGCGHALLPERSAEVAAAVLAFLDRQHPEG